MMYSCGAPISFCPPKIEVTCTCNAAENPCVTEIRTFLESHIGAEVTIYTNNTPASTQSNTGVISTVGLGTVTLTITSGSKTYTAIFSICKINEVTYPPF